MKFIQTLTATLAALSLSFTPSTASAGGIIVAPAYQAPAPVVVVHPAPMMPPQPGYAYVGPRVTVAWDAIPVAYRAQLPRCQAYYWIPARYNPAGRLIPGHYRCAF